MHQQNKLCCFLMKLSPFELTALAIVLGYIFSDGLNYNQVQALGNFVEEIGQTLLVIGTQMQNLEQDIGNMSNSDYDSAIQILKNKIDNIDEILQSIKKLKE